MAPAGGRGEKAPGDHALPSAPLAPLPIQHRVPALEGLVDQDDVVPDALDAVPGDIELLPGAEESKEPGGAVDHDGHCLPLRHLEVHVAHGTQTGAVMNVDNLLAAEVPESQLRCPHPFLKRPYARPGLSYSENLTKGPSIGKNASGDTFNAATGGRDDRPSPWQYTHEGAAFMQGKVEIAGVSTAKLKVLKNEETMELLRRTKEGDQEARRQLIEGNLRLVLSVIQRFSSRGENVDDLFQVGCVGLIKAIDNFDISQPVKFSTYGVPMIIGEIRRYLRDNSAIRVSRSMRDTAYRVLQVRERLISETQREPTVEQIAKELDIPREDVVFAMDAIVDPVSLYEPVYSDGGDALCVMDQVRDTQNTDESWTDRIALKDALKRLDDRERRILSLRFYEGKTQMEVSAEVGISQAQVSRLEKGAINTIKKNI